MAVWTKGFVVTKNKSVFHVVGLVEHALNELIGSVMDTMRANRGRSSDDLFMRRVRITLDTSSRGVDLNFTYEGESRQLTMHFECDGDIQKHLGADANTSGITLMMGCSGGSELFMMTALTALTSLGEVYFTRNDCGDKPYEKLDFPMMSYLEACRQHLLLPSCVSLRRWLTEFKTGTLAGATELEALGLDLGEAQRIVEMNYPDSAMRLRTLANMTEEPETT